MRLPVSPSVSKLGPILHCFWETATYWLKIAIFLPLSYSAPPLSLEFRGEVNRQETRVMALSFIEDRMIVTGVVLT